jgi:hypothetical protein
MKKILFLVATAAAISSCKKDDPATFDANSKGDITIEFDNIVGSSDLQLNTGTYTNASGEAFKVTTLKYYVSNFKFTKTDGTIYTVPQDSSYFLIDESNAASHEPTLSIPEGEYKAVSFMVGVDSLRNTMDISRRTGILDPTTTGMYWGWNSGYIHLMLEGTSPASTQVGNVFQYHIGLFGGMTSPTINNTRTVTLDLTARGTANVKKGKDTDVHLMADILKLFSGSSNLSIAAVSAVHGEANSAAIANNYAAMFTHDHTHN